MASPAPTTQVAFQVDTVLQGPPTRPVVYRILVKPENYVKYLTGPKPLSGFPDDLGKFLGFTTVPPGDDLAWNLGNLVIDEATGKFLLSSTEHRDFPSLMPAWHPSKIQLAEIQPNYYDDHDEEEENDNIEARHEDDDLHDSLQLKGHIPSAPFTNTKSFGKEAVFGFWVYDLDGYQSHGLANASHIYSLLHQQNPSIAPRFLAHLTDNKTRVIGYVLESLPSSARAAGIQDLDLCRKVLHDLHDLGILHGNLHRRAFLIIDEEGDQAVTAKLQSFYMSRKVEKDTDTGRAALEAEMSSLERILSEPLPEEPRVGEEAEVGSEELTAIQERDGFVHPALWTLLKEDGRLDVSEADHKHLLAVLEENDWRCTKEDVEAAVKWYREKNGN